VATLLIVIGCLLAPVSVMAVWTANQVSDTSRYIDNIEPLIHQAPIQNALTDKVTTAITSHINVTGYTNQASALLTSKGLPRVGTLLKTFGPAIAGAVTSFIHSTVHKIVTSARFARAWIQVNTVAHQQLVNALSGRGGSISVSNGQVVIDLAPFIEIVKQDLSARGFTLVNSLPPIHPTLALFSARDLTKAQSGYRLINDLKIVLPILALLLIAVGVYIARGHRRALIGAGLGFAASMLLLGAGLTIFRSIYLNTVPNSVLPSDAAAAMFDTFVRFIRTALRALLVVGLVVAAAAFLTGPSVTAVRTREGIKSGFGWLRRLGERQGVNTGPVGQWTYQHRRGLRISAVGLAALLFVFWGHPTAGVVILLVVLLLVVLGLIELIGRPPAQPEIAGQP
jgi:tetrahydromethanopterin S-methyltransferase subunit B